MIRLLCLAALVVLSLPAAAGVDTATPTESIRRWAFFAIPRGVVVEMPVDPLCSKTGVMIDDHCMRIRMISTGERLVPIESDEGEAIAAERAANVRSDGSIRHRQHHPTDFPPKR